MSFSVLVLTYLLLYSFVGTSHSKVTLNCGNADEKCLEQIVTYQCTTIYPPLRWGLKGGARGLDLTIEPGTSLTSRATVDEFDMTVVSLSPFTSNLTFPISPSVNNLAITCSDGAFEKNCSVKIAGPPDPPDNVMISFNQTNLLINWTPPDSIPSCVTGYMVDTNATSSTLISTTETSISLPLAGRSLTTYYCVRVASIDTGGRIGAFSQKECFQLEATSAQTKLSDYKTTTVHNLTDNHSLSAVPATASTTASVPMKRPTDGETCVTSLILSISLTLLIMGGVTVVTSIITFLFARKHYKDKQLLNTEYQPQRYSLYERVLAPPIPSGEKITVNPAYGRSLQRSINSTHTLTDDFCAKIIMTNNSAYGGGKQL